MALSFSDLTQSQQVLSQLQSQYGTLQAGQLQINRKRFWSYVPFSTSAAVPQLNFFGNSLGTSGTNYQFTNMPVQSSFGTSSFLIKGIETNYFLPALLNASYDGTDETTLYSEIVGGLFQAGVFQLNINAKNYLTIPRPFLQMPPGDGRTLLQTAGQAVASYYSRLPSADLSRRSDNKFLVDPEILIESQQQFLASITFPSGSLATIISSSFTLYVGVILDGIEFRPVQ